MNSPFLSAHTDVRRIGKFGFGQWKKVDGYFLAFSMDDPLRPRFLNIYNVANEPGEILVAVGLEVSEVSHIIFTKSFR